VAAVKHSRRSVLLGALTAAGWARASERQSFAIGRRLVWAFHAGELEGLWKQTSPSLQARLKSVEGLKALQRKVEGDFGVETRLVHEALELQGGAFRYLRTAQFSLYPRGVVEELRYDEQGLLLSVSAVVATREAPSPHLEHEPVTALRLPFDGPWSVLWGGRSWEDNHHAAVPDERFALDLLIYRGGNTFSGEGKLNTDYPCFGLKVCAPAAGQVLTANDGLPDNPPGSINPSRLFGNFVVVDHGNAEYSLLAHLKAGSVAVKPKQLVEAGMPLGLCGNSGVSTEPHLHYQLMDHPNWTRAHGLPAVFVAYRSNGVNVARGEPRRGELLEHLARR
jgi:hypothetical protein